MREKAATKGRRYLAEGRLIVDAVNGQQITARCRGAGVTYRLGHDRLLGWSCTCPARTECAHLVALRLVVDVVADGGDW